MLVHLHFLATLTLYLLQVARALIDIAHVCVHSIKSPPITLCIMLNNNIIIIIRARVAVDVLQVQRILHDSASLFYVTPSRISHVGPSQEPPISKYINRPTP